MTCRECQLALASEDRESLRGAIADEGEAARTAWEAACGDFATEWREGLQGLRDERAASHLAWCSTCQEFAMELRENSAALRELGTDPIPALPKVAFNVAPRDRPSAWWPAAAAGIAAMLMLGFVTSWKIINRHSPRVPVASSVLSHGSPAEELASGEAPAQVRAAALPTRPRAASRSRQDLSQQDLSQRASQEDSSQPDREPRILQVKMLTDDPNVVIYWQIEN